MASHRIGATKLPPLTSRRRACVASLGRASCVRPMCALPAEYSDKLKDFKVLVAGATGRTGREVVSALRELGVPVRALVRDREKASKLFTEGAGLEVVTADVTQFATLPKAFGDANAVIVATGAADPTNPLGPFDVDFNGTKNLVALASQHGVKKFVLVTSIGADEVLNPLNLFWGVL